MEDDYGVYEYEDPTPDYERFEQEQVFRDMDAGEGRDHYEDEEPDVYGGEDRYLDSMYEDRYEVDYGY